jgi:hypothetical protein
MKKRSIPKVKTKLYDIKAWLNYITTIMMSDSERDWYIHWMEDYNNKQSKTK